MPPEPKLALAAVDSSADAEAAVAWLAGQLPQHQLRVLMCVVEQGGSYAGAHGASEVCARDGRRAVGGGLCLGPPQLHQSLWPPVPPLPTSFHRSQPCQIEAAKAACKTRFPQAQVRRAGALVQGGGERGRGLDCNCSTF